VLIIRDPGYWSVFLPVLRIRIGSGFNDFVDPDPDWESGSRIRTQGQKGIKTDNVFNLLLIFIL
jgi:hypothetical protein